MMSRHNRILAVDIGAASIKMAEFEYPPSGEIVLVAFDYREYGEEISDEARSYAVTALLKDMLQAGSFTADKALVCVSGQFALTRFVKLPPVAEEESRVRQIVEFEARQNVPFPMEEVIWDYQLIANPEAEELEVMFVVIKNDIVEEITKAVQNAGLSVLVVDVAPCACYNAARANNIGEQECEMILNIGDRSTNLMFADRQQFFVRTIPIAGHTVTQQIAKEFGIGIDEAEEMKRRHAFVALGGAYAEPESEVASAVSKIVRNVMTRLHGEINRSIGVYRAQQKGNAPARLFLTGGSSTMNCTDVFFNEKLNIDVEYFNPFKVVRLSSGIDTERLQNVAHMFSEVIGLAVRQGRQVPIEISLVPEAIRRQMTVSQKKPYLVACIACILIMLGLALLGITQKGDLYEQIYQSWRGDRQRLESLGNELRQRQTSLASLQKDYVYHEKVLQRREQWPRVLNEIERYTPDHLWVFSVEPVFQEVGLGVVESEGAERERVDEPPRGAREDSGYTDLFGIGHRESETRPGPRHRPVEIESMDPQVLTEIILKGHSLVVQGTPGATTPEGNAEIEQMTVPDTAADGQAGVHASEQSRTPEQLFEARLQQSALFDAENTRITTYTPNREIGNLKTFTLRVRLQKPLPINYPDEILFGADR